MKYIDRLKATQEELDAQQVANKAEEAQARLESRISAKRATLVSLKNQREESLNGYPLNVDAISSANAKVREVAGELDELETIHEELFGGKAAKK